MISEQKVDWSQCSLVESKPKVLHGAPVLRGTRMPADPIIENFDYGLSIAEISEQFELPTDQVDAVISYAQRHRIARSIR